jgi:hypothetical protein
MKYKVLFGFEAEDYIPIDGSELERAVYAHMTGKNVAFEQGSVTGARIVAIQPDYHSAMGWNRGYQLEAEDYADIASKGVDVEHKNFQIRAKERVQYLIETKREHLIGKNTELPELDAPAKHEISNATKTLADKFKM